MTSSKDFVNGLSHRLLKQGVIDPPQRSHMRRRGFASRGTTAPAVSSATIMAHQHDSVCGRRRPTFSTAPSHTAPRLWAKRDSRPRSLKAACFHPR